MLQIKQKLRVIILASVLAVALFAILSLRRYGTKKLVLDGQWITTKNNGLGGGGKHIYFDDDGTITKGLPRHMLGKKPQQAFTQAYSFNAPAQAKNSATSTTFNRPISNEELRASWAKGQKLLKANPLPDSFKSQQEGQAYLSSLMPHTKIYLHLLSATNLHSIAKGIYLAGSAFPFLLESGIKEISHYISKDTVYQNQATKRKQIAQQLVKDSAWRKKAIAYVNQQIELVKKTLAHLNQQDQKEYIKQYLHDLNISLRDAKLFIQTGSYMKEISKALLSEIHDKTLVEQFNNANLIQVKPYDCSPHVATYIPRSEAISLSNAYFSELVATRLQSEYDLSVDNGWSYQLKSDISPSTAIVFHELMHALDSKLLLNSKAQIVSLFQRYHRDYSSNTRSRYVGSSIFEFVADNLAESYLGHKPSKYAKEVQKIVCDHLSKRGLKVASIC